MKEKLEQFKADFDPIFIEEIKKMVQRQQELGGDVAVYDNHLASVMADYCKGGKRIRPFLLSLMSGNDINDTDTRNASLALEVIHLFAVIHDDIMDEDSMRRGVATIHAAFEPLQGHNHRLGQDIAILMGDLALAHGIELAQDLAPELRKHIFDMISRTVRGQYLDAVGMNMNYGDVTYETILDRYLLKTAWYSFATPMLMGAHIQGDYSINDMAIIEHNSLIFGKLFQIRDDAKDMIAESHGKNRFGDIFSNQTTWLTLAIKENYPEAFEQILAAKTAKSSSLLEGIFKEIDLESVYSKAFKQQTDQLQKTDREDLQKTFDELLALLTL